MATTAQVIVEAGYARATSSDPGKLASDGELLGRLNRVYQSIYALASRQRPEEFTSSSNMTLAGTPATSTFAACAPSLTDVIEIRRIVGVSGAVAAGGRIHLVSETESFRTWQIAPVMFRRGLSLFSRQQAGDPVATDVVQLIVLDSPTPLTTLAINIDTRFPVRHQEILSNDLAIYLDAKEDGKRNGILMADQKLKLGIFASEYNLAASAIEEIFADRVPSASAGA